MTPLITTVFEFAGPQRNKTFARAAEFILTMQNPTITETGCYRGAACDGQSTLILAMMAQASKGTFFSFDLDIDHIKLAEELLLKHNLQESCEFSLGDSITGLQDLNGPVHFAYLDSCDFEENRPITAQAHQLAEAAILLPKMAPRSAFLLDDCSITDGGKAKLSSAAILASGYKETETAYQRLFIRA